MEPADKVAPLDVAVGEKFLTVAAASVEDGVFHAAADDDEVDSFEESTDRLSIWEFVSDGDTGWLHSFSSVCDGSIVLQNWVWWGELVHEAGPVRLSS
jgi:hypothetical protein